MTFHSLRKELQFYHKYRNITAKNVFFISELGDLPVRRSVRIPVSVHFAGRLINSNEVRVCLCVCMCVFVCVCFQTNKVRVQLVPVIKPYR